ncbi:uncharacterized protein LOC133850652 [Drosophila sulfurigaster albostrigata]|uniref:uncharacterized protein LOC133850652 n=1 Tax=Drosophila sulfurigaster albostrigata TaxID=89887 RepID=UPI002D21B7A3|nr:uncharacterized protein LOC133850652 [Drosophila sulfurigaster albostrigata]
MKYTPEISYNADEKVWIGKNPPAYFSPDLSVGQVIFHEMKRHPKLIAQISVTENTVLTREELLLNSMRVAIYLRNLGLEQSDVIGIIARNTTHLFAVAYACFFNGIAFHSANVNYEQDKIRKLYGITKPKIIFCDGDEYEKVEDATKHLNLKIVTMRNHKDGSISIDDVLATPVDPFFQPARLEEGMNQTLAILCSSGTTGTPKAVTIPNEEAIKNVLDYVNTSDVLFTTSGLDWVSGFVITLTSGVQSALRIITDQPFNASHVLRLIKKYKVTLIMAPPPQMAQMVNCPEFKEDYLDSVLYYFYGGSGCSLEVQNRFRGTLSPKCMLIFGYGFTEFRAGIISNYHFDQKPGSVGRPIDDVKLKIIDEQNEPQGPNIVGELCVYSDRYWAGYYGNPEESRKFRDSNLWYHTGDLGYIDDDGFLFIVDRKKDMLKYQNIMYYPNEIEKVISEMPEVSEVCVFGVLNNLNDDEASAAVVKKLGAQLEPQDVVNYVAKRIHADYLQLHGGVFIVDNLKRLSNGKTDRRATKAYCLGPEIKN